MKRNNRLAGWLAGDALKHSSAAIAALMFAAVRGLRLVPDELPTMFLGTINLLEWAAGCLGLVFIFLDKFYKRSEKEYE